MSLDIQMGKGMLHRPIIIGSADSFRPRGQAGHGTESGDRRGHPDTGRGERNGSSATRSLGLTTPVSLSLRLYPTGDMSRLRNHLRRPHPADARRKGEADARAGTSTTPPRAPEQSGLGWLAPSGLFPARSRSWPEATDVSITTSVATLGIRGTEFWGGPIDDQALGVFLIRKAPVSVSNARGEQILGQRARHQHRNAGRSGKAPTSQRRAQRPDRSPSGPGIRIDRALAGVTFR